MRATPLLILLAEVLVFYRKILFLPDYAIPWDAQGYHLPLLHFAATRLRRGEIPLWDPLTYCGFPFFANIQTQLFYPPAWITVGLANLFGLRHALLLLDWQVVLHVFLGGAFAWWLLRRLKLGTVAATFGATVFQLGGYFTSQTQHVGAVAGAAWMPLVWLSVISLAGGFRWRWLAALALGLAMSILAGFPAVASVVFASAAMLALLLVLFRQARPALLAVVALGAVWSLLLAAVQLLPTLEIISLSAAHLRGGWGSGTGVPLRGLGSLLVPDFNGVIDIHRFKLPYNPTFLYLYCGIPALLLALAGAFTTRRRGALFSIVTFCAGAWMMGSKTPIGVWVDAITPDALSAPLYSEFAMPAFQLGLAVLAALGAERWIAPRRPWIGYGLILVAAADLTLAGSGLPFHIVSLRGEPGVSVEQFEGSPVTLHRMQALVNRTAPPARIEAYDDSRNWTTAAPITNVPTANGDDPLALARILKVRLLFAKGAPWERYYTLSNLNSPMLDLLNIRYVLNWAPSEEPALRHPKYALTEQLPGHQVYENRGVLPRFFLVGEVRGVDGLERAIAALNSPAYDPRRMAVVEGHPGGGSPRELPAVEVLSYADTRIELAVNAPVPSYLVTSETWYPGWHARVDGREEPLLMTNAAFRGLPVPAGRHRISMYFAPASFRLGAGITLLAFALSFVSRFLPARPRSPARAGTHPAASPPSTSP